MKGKKLLLITSIKKQKENYNNNINYDFNIIYYYYDTYKLSSLLKKFNIDLVGI